MQQRSGDKGFTLVELAIVLVIIGIIIGAVLRGQQMIEGAKLKRLYNQQREIIAAIYSYYDKYGKFPGDDNTAATRWVGTTNGNNNGQIGTSVEFACTEGATTETCQAWRHLRNANLITGATTSAVNPTHAYGLAIGVGYATVQTLAANWIGFDEVPYDVCQSIDLQYDDGAYNTGSIRGSGNYDTATSGNFDLYFRL
ncbi:MAG: prepilin-type N-terminal cleavage/methylation domain-containing protein [Nitrospirae bacterium]|nr:prepilin-type N-terminal cleavage/methylation domain-containing protein [Nitrospirota bacterium]